ncbi:hypothetical protein CK203_080548 [Vitis vinifera]|uniref:DUF4283 domain-containing protein n=1 Tax=Vitis vinifera TaxID=29760 RepID=A0A438D9L4_VITVI|nr:hypothetical protein CK203_080548 [Vitis vinifera]
MGGERWEESDLARFSQFLGFSTEGLEKDILEFMVKIRKRRERIHSKAMLEKSKFERELRRLECSVNYEGGRRERVLCKEEGAKLWKSNENKAFELECTGSMIVPRGKEVPGLGCLDAQGAAGGILICWDKRTLEILEMEMGQFTISCRLRNVEDGKTWIFTGVYGPFSKETGTPSGGSLGRLGESGMILGVLGVTDELELLDIPLHGGVASWSGGRNNQAWARLDRFLVTQDWLDCFSGVLQCRLPRPVSDHFPILLKEGGEAGGRGRASFRVASKLKFLKDKIKSWNREVFVRAENEAKEAFKNWVLLEETHWRQSSRELWLREGDKNTGFFHRMANAHRRNNSMDKIKINGRWLEEERELKSLNHAEAEGLEQPFTEAEIHLALMGMNGDKAPGPDGFTVAFWHSVGRGAEDLGDFRPISCLGVCISSWPKCCPTELKVLDKVVSPDQNAFVKGRQILDASLIANEVIDYWLKRKEKGVICHAEDGLWGPVVEMDLVVYFNGKLSILVNGVPAGYFPTLGGYAKVVHPREGGNGDKSSGLRINLAKSEVIPVGEVEDIEMLAVELGCKVGTLPSVYLGLPWEPSTRPWLCGMGLKQE